MDSEKRAGGEAERTLDPAVDDFFRRLKEDLGHPKPGTEAIAAALQTVQRMESQSDVADSVSGLAEGTATRICHSCGSPNPAANRFCAICGVPQDSASREAGTSGAKAVKPAAGQHHYHHHYHHHYFASAEGGTISANSEWRAPVDAPAGREARTRPMAGAAGLSRAEAAIRKLTQDWALACNTKQLEDLVELYAADAVVLRPNVPMVRGMAAIREFFFGSLSAGLGEVELETLKVEILGDLAYEAGRCKMLVPAMGKRREERGKYLLSMARQAGEWKILADCWSNDLSLGVADTGPARPGLPGSAVKPTH